ncbi:CBS domain-containing protein [Sulfitobacter sp. D35]|uniref:CBS domain-containing protein n=1 Tax=Sulfitobacter sp. D35 TaxID=3083252 RepID=UPI00296F2F72|nr:CBS domain-containing protein [Sulfitobacter sp. D35]MDW4500400.1 CBS domain-containing protein [Sulfitobacter sp. D35]
MKFTKLADVISSGPVHKTTPDESVQTACMILSAANVGALPVVDLNGDLVGMLSERDVIRRCVIVNRTPDKTTVKQVMTPNPQWLPPDAKPAEAVAVMNKGRFRHLPVCDHGKVVGMVSIRDFQPAGPGLGARLRKSLSPATG